MLPAEEEKKEQYESSKSEHGSSDDLTTVNPGNPNGHGDGESTPANTAGNPAQYQTGEMFSFLGSLFGLCCDSSSQVDNGHCSWDSPPDTQDGSPKPKS